MKKLMVILLFTIVLTNIAVIPQISAKDISNDTKESGSGMKSEEDLTGRSRKIASNGQEKHDGYWWNYGSTWNSVSSSYDNDQPHSSSTKADGILTRSSSEEANVRTYAVDTDPGGIQYSQQVYYNYW